MKKSSWRTSGPGTGHAEQAGIPITVEVRPPSAGYREAAHWQFELN
ncbi:MULTISPECIES: hypothetical protein [unclassified Streptomyces]|nr:MULTISPECIES: hypothetical protein [unclassified Streptomyces]WSR23259.1 hypothetical protein OG573_31765 [Streptomyces sp. NBC_01205]